MWHPFEGWVIGKNRDTDWKDAVCGKAATDDSPFIRPRIGFATYFPNRLLAQLCTLSGIADGVNQALKKCEGDFDYPVFLVDH